VRHAFWFEWACVKDIDAADTVVGQQRLFCYSGTALQPLRPAAVLIRDNITKHGRRRMLTAPPLRIFELYICRIVFKLRQQFWVTCTYVTNHSSRPIREKNDKTYSLSLVHEQFVIFARLRALFCKFLNCIRVT